MRTATTVLVLLALAAAASADEIRLRSGGTLTGIARIEGDTVVVEMGIGTATIPRSEVLEIRPGRTALHEYAERCAKVDRAPTAAALYDLALWAGQNGLPRYVPSLLRRVIELEPGHREARATLGHVLHEGAWMTEAEHHQSLGQVQFRGRWLKMAERDGILAVEARGRAGSAKTRNAQRRVTTTRAVEPSPYRLGFPLVEPRPSRVWSSDPPGSAWDAPFWPLGLGGFPFMGFPRLALPQGGGHFSFRVNGS